MKAEIVSLCTFQCIKYILTLVILNMLFSYGMLYFADYILRFTSFDSFLLSNSILTAGFFTTAILSPIAEELIFRGVLLNRLKLAVPTIFAVLISSLLFAALHSFGSIFSAFIFGICMAVLYMKTDNVFAPILAHILNNLFAQIIVAADKNQILFTNSLVVGTVSILAVLSFILLLRLMAGELNNLK